MSNFQFFPRTLMWSGATIVWPSPSSPPPALLPKTPISPQAKVPAQISVLSASLVTLVYILQGIHTPRVSSSMGSKA